MRRLGTRFGRRGGARARVADPITATNPFVRWRADSGVDNASAVGSWIDSVGGVDYAQSTSINKPDVFNLAALGNQPTIRFTATNEALQAATTAAFWNFIHNGTTGATFYYVYSTTGGAWQNALATSTSASTPGMYLTTWMTGTTAYAMCSNGDGVLKQVGVASAPATGWHAARYSVASPNITVQARHSAAGSWSSSAAFAPSAGDAAQALRTNGLSGQTVYVAEIIGYQRSVSDADHTTIAAYFLSRYGV